MIALDYTACSRTNAGDICMVTCARGDYPRDGRASTCLCKGGAWVGQVSCTPCWAGLVSPGGSITVCTKCNTAFGRIPNAFKSACTSPPGCRRRARRRSASTAAWPRFRAATAATPATPLRPPPRSSAQPTSAPPGVPSLLPVRVTALRLPAGSGYGAQIIPVACTTNSCSSGFLIAKAGVLSCNTAAKGATSILCLQHSGTWCPVTDPPACKTNRPRQDLRRWGL